MYGRGHGTGERKPRRKQLTRKQVLANIAFSISQREAEGRDWSFEEYGIDDEREQALIMSMVEP